MFFFKGVRPIRISTPVGGSLPPRVADVMLRSLGERRVCCDRNQEPEPFGGSPSRCAPWCWAGAVDMFGHGGHPQRVARIRIRKRPPGLRWITFCWHTNALVAMDSYLSSKGLGAQRKSIYFLRKIDEFSKELDR